MEPRTPRPEALTRTAHALTAPDGTRLHLREAVHPAPRARVMIVHGYSDHVGRYDRVMTRLAARGLSVAAGDLRGHGESAGARGHIERFEHYVDDLQTMLGHLHGDDAAPRLPLFLLGHSLGGLVAACHARRFPGSIDGLILAAPFAALRFPVPAWKRGMAWLLSRAWPGFSLPSGMPPDLLSHDPESVAAYATDPLVFRRATARWYTETISAQARVLATASTLDEPLLLVLAGEDRVVCNAAARRLQFALGSRDAQVREYPGLYHDLFQELDQARVVDDIAAWIQQQLEVRTPRASS